MTAIGGGVSVILPVRNHAKALPEFFDSLAESHVLEVLVCDFGSSDDSVLLCRQHGAHVFVSQDSPPVGVWKAATHARGDVLWFLSPWVRPLPKLGAYIYHDVETRDMTGGAFRITAVTSGVRDWWQCQKRNWSLSWKKRIALANAPFISREALAPEAILADADMAARGVGQTLRARFAAGTDLIVPEYMPVCLAEIENDTFLDQIA